MTFLYVLTACYFLYITINLGNISARIKKQFEDTEPNWGFAYEWLFAGLIHSIAEIVVFLILSVPATIHCLMVLPSIVTEVYTKRKLQPRE